MKHLDEPGRDDGFFSTEEVRSRNDPDEETSRLIAFPKNHYQQAPNLAAGFKMLDLAHAAPLRVNLVGSDITPTGFRILVETWDGGICHAAHAQWIEHRENSREVHFGQFDTRDVHVEAGDCNGRAAETARRIKFPLPYREPPEVVCWLNRVDMGGGGGRNYRLKAHATDVGRKSFVGHLDSWGDTLLNGAAMCWISFPRKKRKVDSGAFSTSDVRPWHDPRSKNSKRVRFKEGWFERPPTVLVALNMFDMAGNADLRVNAWVEDVTSDGFTWHLDTWDDSTLYAAGASWIALGFV